MVADLPPNKDPKGGSPTAGKPLKPKSSEIRHATVQDYLAAHSHANGHGWKGFLRSNLFAALIIWVLSQIALFTGTYFLTYARTNQLLEWKTSVDLNLRRMDEWGTVHGHYADERQDASITELQAKSRSQTELESRLGELVSASADRNNQQDKQIATVEAKLNEMIPSLVEIKAKLTFVADLLDERTKERKR